ncbi:hypothetical protein KY289_019971 [Solanum tuberosum]|nr:hypothetical protein KY289_019971 [Solanum tuberosum]
MFLSKDKPQQIWNPRRKENNEPQQVTTTNKFKALGDMREIDETQENNEPSSQQGLMGQHNSLLLQKADEQSRHDKEI